MCVRSEEAFRSPEESEFVSLHPVGCLPGAMQRLRHLCSALLCLNFGQQGTPCTVNIHGGHQCKRKGFVRKSTNARVEQMCDVSSHDENASSQQADHGMCADDKDRVTPFLLLVDQLLEQFELRVSTQAKTKRRELTKLTLEQMRHRSQAQPKDTVVLSLKRPPFNRSSLSAALHASTSAQSLPLHSTSASQQVPPTNSASKIQNDSAKNKKHGGSGKRTAESEHGGETGGLYSEGLAASQRIGLQAGSGLQRPSKRARNMVALVSEDAITKMGTDGRDNRTHATSSASAIRQGGDLEEETSASHQGGGRDTLSTAAAIHQCRDGLPSAGLADCDALSSASTISNGSDSKVENRKEDATNRNLGKVQVSDRKPLSEVVENVSERGAGRDDATGSDVDGVRRGGMGKERGRVDLVGGLRCKDRTTTVKLQPGSYTLQPRMKRGTLRLRQVFKTKNKTKEHVDF